MSGQQKDKIESTFIVRFSTDEYRMFLPKLTKLGRDSLFGRAGKDLIDLEQYEGKFKVRYSGNLAFSEWLKSFSAKQFILGREYPDTEII